MATLSVGSVVVGGLAVSPAAVAAGGDEFVNDGRTFVEIRNSSGANAYTVTFAAAKTYKGHTIADKDVSIGTSAEKVVGPFPTDVFNDSDAKVQITYTGSAPATDLTIQVFKLPA